MDNLKRQELERAVKLEKEELATQVVLNKMRDNPNQHLHQMATEVDLLSRKIDPILKRVEMAQDRIQNLPRSKLSDQPGPVGMLSKMGGRLIAFYADDLATMLLEDFLTETVKDLQVNEERSRKQLTEEESK